MERGGGGGGGRAESLTRDKLATQRRNLLGITKYECFSYKNHTLHDRTLHIRDRCVFASLPRMCVKSLVDKAAFEAVEDDCLHLNNFCTVMEHVFTHRIQGHFSSYRRCVGSFVVIVHSPCFFCTCLFAPCFYIYMYIHVYTCMYMYAPTSHTHTHTHTHTHSNILIFRVSASSEHTHTYIHTHTHTHTHTLYMYTHTYTHTHTHTHTHTQCDGHSSLAPTLPLSGSSYHDWLRPFL